jgi:hypothetical protein
MSSTGTLYTGPFAISATSTVKAVACTSAATSGVSSATYTILNYRVNCGGAAIAPFIADTFFSGGTASSTTAAISTAGVTNAAPASVYQTERWGAHSYTFGSLTVGRTYTVRMHFAEIWFGTGNPGGGGVGSRIFNVNLNGSPVLQNFDILAVAGAPNKANVQQFTVTANTSGQIVVQLATGSANYPKISAIEILP